MEKEKFKLEEREGNKQSGSFNATQKMHMSRRYEEEVVFIDIIK